MEVILFEPEIPQNCGNIARTCAVTCSKLTLVRPLGFAITSRHFKRAGLDYWDKLDFRIVDSLEGCLKEPFYFFSTKSKNIFTETAYTPDCQLIFGSETKGLPPYLHEKYKDHFLTIPMGNNLRSLNVSNAVAIALYEALKQFSFAF